MQVTEVTANLTGIFYCPSCSTANGATALAEHGIDYVGKKTPDDKRLAYCTACGYAMEVNYPVGAPLPRNISCRWEPCEECGGAYKHHNGNEPCERCHEGGWWVEDTGEPTIAELIGEKTEYLNKTMAEGAQAFLDAPDKGPQKVWDIRYPGTVRVVTSTQTIKRE